MRRPRARHRGPRASALAGTLCILALTVLATLPALAEGDHAKFLEAARQRHQARQAAQEQELGRLVHQARLLIDQHHYDQARRLLLRAQQIRPDDDSCRRLLAMIEASSPDTPADNLLASLKAERQHQGEAIDRQIALDLFQARQALGAKQYGRACEYAERVLASVDHGSDAAAARQARADAEAVLDAARNGQAGTLAERQATELAAARGRAAEHQAAELRALRERGWRLHEKGQFEDALAVATEMLAVDAHSKEAIFLRQEAQKAIDQRNDPKAIRAERRARTREHLVDQIEKEMTVDTAAPVVLRGPEDGLKGPTQALARPMPRWESVLRAKLREPVTVGFRQTTVADACHTLSQVTDSPILVDPLLARRGERFDLPEMTLTFKHWLDWVCRFNKATWTLRDHAILVTTRGGGKLNRPVSRGYDVTGLLVPARTVRAAFDGPTQRERGGPRTIVMPELPVEDGEPKLEKDIVGEGWVHFIKSTVAPESWGQVLQEEPQYTISYRNGRIVVVHTPDVQDQIEEMLNNFRRARNLQVHIFARFLSLDLEFLTNYDLDLGDDTSIGDPPVRLGPYGYDSDVTWDPVLRTGRRSYHLLGDLINRDETVIGGSLTKTGGLEIGPWSLGFQYLSDEEVWAFLRAVKKSRRGTLLIAPRLTCFNTQRANFQAVTNFNYVRSISADNEPEIGNVPDGIVFDIQPFVSADHRYVTLILQPQLRTLREFTIVEYVRPPVGFIGRQRFIQVPEVELKSVATTITIPDGGTVLVGGLAKADEAAGTATVPFLGSIPLIGCLFREWTEAENRSSLVILVTATIVPDIFEE